MMLRSRRPLLFLALLGVAGCGRATHAAETVTVTGSSTIAPLMLEIGRRFEQQHPGTRVDVQTGGSGRGLADARSGLADIGMVSRALGPEETDLMGHTIALDGVAILVHADNPLTSIDRQSVIDIFTGKLATWGSLGGDDSPITVVSKAEGRSTLEVFLDHFELESADIAASVVVGDNEQGVKTVAGNPDAIAYVSIGAAEYSIASGTPVRLLALDGIEASSASLAAGRFPLSRPLNLVVGGAEEGEPAKSVARSLIAFASSPAVHDLVQAQGLVPLSN